MLNKNKKQLSYFIADLHLAENRPDITACFLSFLSQQAPEAEKLFILGDLFEYWVGDDDNSPFVIEIASAIEALSKTGTHVYFVQGNRDFLLGKKYSAKSAMTLLPDVSKLHLYNQDYVILHGDTLCIDDVDYQNFRRKSRSWWWQTMIKCLPLWVRKKIAADYRKKSAQANAYKSQEIMDVTKSEVDEVLKQYEVNLMIHGHTHRPAVHEFELDGQKSHRIVLGDWYEQGAWLKVTPDGFELLNQPFS